VTARTQEQYNTARLLHALLPLIASSRTSWQIFHPCLQKQVGWFISVLL